MRPDVARGTVVGHGAGADANKRQACGRGGRERGTRGEIFVPSKMREKRPELRFSGGISPRRVGSPYRRSPFLRSGEDMQRTPSAKNGSEVTRLKARSTSLLRDGESA